MQIMRRSQGCRSLVALALAVAVLATGACADDAADADGSSPSTTTTFAPDTTETTGSPGDGGTDADSVALPYESGTLEVTEDGVWVFPHLDPVALRIDPETMAVDLEISLPAYVTESVYGEGMLWVWTEDDQSSLTRLDPATGDVLARVPDLDVGDPSIAFGSVWMPGLDGHVTRLDPETNQTERIRFQSGGAFYLTATTDRMWALGADGLVGFDPATGAFTEPWRPLTLLGEIPTGMDSGGGDTLLFATVGRLSEIHPVERRLLGSVDAPEGTTPMYGVNRYNGRGEPPTWIFAPPEQMSPERGEPLPDVVVARLELDPLRIAGTVEVAFPEGHVRSGNDLWTTPLRDQVVVRSDAP